jgi:hypothetical protein
MTVRLGWGVARAGASAWAAYAWGALLDLPSGDRRVRGPRDVDRALRL